MNNHNWPEATTGEYSSLYEHTCLKCQSQYIAYKHRLICRACYVFGEMNITQEDNIKMFLDKLDVEHPWEQIEERQFPEYESCEALGIKYREEE